MVFVKDQIRSALAHHLTRIRVDSDSCVHAHDEVEHILNRLKQVLAVIDFDVELVFDCIMHQHARLDAHLIVLIVPVRFESDRNTVPAVWVDVPQAIAADLDATLC